MSEGDLVDRRYYGHGSKAQSFRSSRQGFDTPVPETGGNLTTRPAQSNDNKWFYQWRPMRFVGTTPDGDSVIGVRRAKHSYWFRPPCPPPPVVRPVIRIRPILRERPIIRVRPVIRVRPIIRVRPVVSEPAPQPPLRWAPAYIRKPIDGPAVYAPTQGRRWVLGVASAGCALVGIMIITAIALGIGFAVKAKSPNLVLMSRNSTGLFMGECTFYDIAFTPDLENPNSAAYRHLEAQMCKAVVDAITQANSSFIATECRVLKFLNGTCIVDFATNVTYPSENSITDVARDCLRDITHDINQKGTVMNQFGDTTCSYFLPVNDNGEENEKISSTNNSPTNIFTSHKTSTKPHDTMPISGSHLSISTPKTTRTSTKTTISHTTTTSRTTTTSPNKTTSHTTTTPKKKKVPTATLR